MEKKIYIVTSGEYSDYHIEAVFSTKEKANDYIQQNGTDYNIEEYDLDEEVVKETKVWRIEFEITAGTNKMTRAFIVDNTAPIVDKLKDTCIVEEYIRHLPPSPRQYIIFVVEADTMSRAIKIASERFAAVKANEYIWLRLTRPYEMDRYGKRKYERFNVRTNEFTTG